ncbi:DNA polymerase [Nocardia amikacinitolerans]|uniref:Type-4 uracil-DNA glycosylase n=1 Tax=Nocardia amikacinitolerans TaxID=756689 RepID=A0A285KX76_9NOCA|nr:UdgX family uracil-DNA binding protein [Nocardia amikacinitolerans]MCP2276134.1 DNA polymerase [Nocardia amikacinitolerans]MCP2294405.1 DNA polymerase [Nocardia amikacinitolerans]MCP2314700.1 DNA polymerase [Nocardia amikacinitolerans]SNY77245.1 DNA polymerase [Nocardia amikacinitolerans]
MGAGKAKGAEEFVPAGADLDTLRAASCGCHGCELYHDATQTVFGEGPADASVFVVGEQPGDREDIEGHPFVGPAGRLLDKALEEVGIDRDTVYVTNAVKHFKFEERGKRRIHKTPGRTEVVACTPWLTAELDAIHPELVVCLGAVAAKAVLGPSFKVSEERGNVVFSDDYRVVATVHPSAVLRAPDRDAAYKGFVEDLRAVRAAMDAG